MSHSNPIRIAVIGYGYWSPKLIRNIAALPAFELRIICEKDLSRHARIAEEQSGVEILQHYRDVFSRDDIDAVIIATIPSSHFRIAKLALEQGKHVLVEKPLTLDPSEGAWLVAFAKKQQRILMVDHTYLYAPAIQELKTRIEQGELGRLYSVESSRANLGLFQRDTNVVWDLAPHDFSILTYLVGERPTHVTALGSKTVVHPAQKRSQESSAHLLLSYASGLAVHVYVSWTSPVKTRQLTIVGSDKMALFDEGASSSLVIFDQGVYPTDTEGESGPLFTYKLGEQTAVPLPEGENIARMLTDFAQAISTKRAPISHGELALTVVRLLAASEQSLRKGGQRVRVAYTNTDPLTHIKQLLKDS